MRPSLCLHLLPWRTKSLTPPIIPHTSPPQQRVSLELGGNAPFIVFADADLELAARGSVLSALRNAGQTCICTNRVFVHASVHDKFAGEAG